MHFDVVYLYYHILILYALPWQSCQIKWYLTSEMEDDNPKSPTPNPKQISNPNPKLRPPTTNLMFPSLMTGAPAAAASKLKLVSCIYVPIGGATNGGTAHGVTPNWEMS